MPRRGRRGKEAGVSWLVLSFSFETLKGLEEHALQRAKLGLKNRGSCAGHNVAAVHADAVLTACGREGHREEQLIAG